MRAISSLILEVGRLVDSCIALLALRMRASMSAIGSVIIAASPTRLRHARDHALVRELPQADPAQPELAEHRARTAAAVAARVATRLELRRPLLLDHERFLRHLAFPPTFRVRKRHTERREERVGLLVRLGRRRERPVEAADLLNVVV